MHQNGNRADVSIKNQMIEEVISSCAKDALEQVLGSNKVSSGSKSLFSINSGMGGYNVKPVFTYPPSYGLNEEDCLKTYKDALGGLSFPDSIATFIPEPVSAVQAAKSLSLLKAPEGPVMVVDVGASTTTLSIVDSGKIQYHSSLNGFGGETLINALMDYMSKEFYGRHHEDVDDQMGVQRLYDAAQGAIMEISSQSKKSHGRVQINIPFLSVDEKMKPRHLNIGVSASVLEAEFNDMVAKEIVPQFAIKQDVLSLSMQNPTDLSLLFSSMIMRVFEESNQNPFALNSLLVVGGGARSPIIQKAIRNACATLAGEQFVQDKVIVPKDELVEELVVLGGTVK
jgi:molecular chaperone DnaK (HSP70)